jgi:hypothetical protein
MTLALILAILVPMLMGATFLLGRHLQRRQPARNQLSPVSRQHIDLIQGGPINEAAVEAAKVRFRDLLERGEIGLVEASLRPGMHYVFQVRALAEIGTEMAGKILERQLQRRLTDDHLEQSWYLIDLACSLRLLNRQESLPHLLRCAEKQAENPLSHFFAAETVCFLGFAGYLRHPQTPLGRSALRLLHRVLEGLRFDLPPQVVTESRLGEVIENLWDHRPEKVPPVLVRITQEIVKLLRRVPHARHFLAEEKMEQEAYSWQISRLTALEPMLVDFLKEAPIELLAQLETSRGQELVGVLHALGDLRVDAGEKLLPLLDRLPYGPLEEAIHVLTWSKHPMVGPWLRSFAVRKVSMGRRAQSRKRSATPRKPSVAREVPYRALLRALRGHPSEETETFLILAARDWDPLYRQAACSSLGWWEPLQRMEIIGCLNQCRRDPNPEVRQTARAALGRLGERQALQWFRQALLGDVQENIHEAMHVIAAEGLFMLWPDLDRLADSDNPDVAHHAREALECLSEEMSFSPCR